RRSYILNQRSLPLVNHPKRWCTSTPSRGRYVRFHITSSARTFARCWPEPSTRTSAGHPPGSSTPSAPSSSSRRSSARASPSSGWPCASTRRGGRWGR
ncbi:unnamed protein product, partial [Prorocentrum cordatum]